MEAVNLKLTVLFEALETLEKGITLFDRYGDIVIVTPTQENEELLVATRDSMIQRFEYCTDLFWKTLKFYLEKTEKIDVSINSPRGIIREATKARVVSENEGGWCMEMVECRNKTSHAYHELMAEEIAIQIPEFYDLMKVIAQRIQGNEK